jgi:hypothetical protein
MRKLIYRQNSDSEPDDRITFEFPFETVANLFPNAEIQFGDSDNVEISSDNIKGIHYRSLTDALVDSRIGTVLCGRCKRSYQVAQCTRNPIEVGSPMGGAVGEQLLCPQFHTVYHWVHKSMAP